MVPKHYQPFKERMPDRLRSALVSEAIEEAKRVAEQLSSRFKAERVVLFGSLARGHYHDRSDIDLAVSGVPVDRFFRAVAFATGFSKKWEIDLVDSEDCRPALRDVIEQEGIQLWPKLMS